MPTLAQIRDAADTWLAARWPTVVNRQSTYFANHNRYWQGLRTHSNFPIDAIESLADLLDTHPTDQLESWHDAIDNLPVNWPCALVMDVYQGPQGWGYCASVYVYVSQLNRIYSRSQNVGPEGWRTQPWHEVIPLP